MPKNPNDLEAKSGGNAAAAGMAFQANVAAQFALSLLTERPLDTALELVEARAVSVRCETEAPVDDILVETSHGGFVFIQAKTSLNFSAQLSSGLGSAVQQAVRLWIACAEGSGKRRWDRPLDRTRDRIVFAVGPGASASLTDTLSGALQRHRAAISGAPTQAERNALDRFAGLVDAAWLGIGGRLPANSERDGLLRLIHLMQFDFDGADQIAAIEMLRPALQDSNAAESGLHVLRQSFLKLMTARRGVDAAALRSGLVSLGVKLNAPPSFLEDVSALQAYSDRTRAHLESYEKTAVHQFEAKINRRCTDAVLQAANSESVLLVGEPGAGKSAVVSAAAAALRKGPNTVIELAVDRLPVSSLDGLSRELELSNSVVSVLRNWPGDDPAYLFIDALDATRGGPSEAVFRALIGEVLNLPGGRWRVIASIRSFDLRMGERFKELFSGKPPNREFADPAFSAVRHISVPHWTDDELRQIEEQVPPIKTAFERGGARLRALAAVPFNTRLLADLLSSGVAADAFGDVTTQVELLDLYWSKRVTQHGPAAELCLRQAVGEMVRMRALRANRLNIAQLSPTGLEALLIESVLITLAGERYVAFRHHVLFDYAASRVYLDVSDVEETAQLLTAESALGLMLGPALMFSLHHVWSPDSPGKPIFWTVVTRLVSDSRCDPIIRSTAARAGSDLPASGADFDGLMSRLDRSESAAETSKTITHVVGSLSVKAEDGVSFPIPAWCALAECLSAHVNQVAWPLRNLLFLLIARETGPVERISLGKAARRLLAFGLAEKSGGALVNAAIGFVGDTYSTNAEASKALLQQLFEPERFETHGHEDIPWLARKVAEIAKVDPDFAITIYANVFTGAITDNSETSLGQSRILPLTSTRRQDYEMAQWSLAEYFPKFLEHDPVKATISLVEAINGYVEREHPIREGARVFFKEIGGHEIRLIEDWSFIWAHDPDDQQHDNALRMLVEFVKRMNEVPAAVLREAAQEIISRNSLGLLWARLMLIGARRPDILGKVLWPYATQSAFLTLSDTMKDSADLVAQTYPLQPDEARARFERYILTVQFPEHDLAGDARGYFLRRILGTIGSNQLVTEDAKVALTAATYAEPKKAVNERPFQSSGVTVSSVKDDWWLKQQGVDTETLPNAEVLRRQKAVKEEFGGNKREFSADDFDRTLSRLTEFLNYADTASGVDDRVRSDALGVFGEALNTLVSSNEDAATETEERISKIVALITRLSAADSPELSADTEKDFESSAAWGSPAPRIDAAHLSLMMSRTSKSALSLLRPTILSLLKDKHPAVRMAISSHVNALWETDRALMWQIAEQVVAEEPNSGVLRFFANSALGRLVWAAPDDVERLVTELLQKADGQSRGLSEEIGSLIGLLWIGSGRDRARTIIVDWLSDIQANQEFIDHAVSMLRGNIIAGYGKPDKRAEEVRHRSHEMARWVVDAAAKQLVEYLNLRTPTSDQQSRAGACAKVVNHLSNQFYFSSGAFRHGKSDQDSGLVEIDKKKKFLFEVGTILWKISEVATPATLHHLIDLFEFLIPADPPQIFDLVAHALLGAGKSHGYHFEQLGADRVVEIVGRFLADYRYVFEDDIRRRRLIDCLDAFIEAGWPSARRLLYRLPELLQ